MIFVARETEIGVFERLIADCASDPPNGQIALVTGPAGIGKSALLRVFAERATTAGIRPLRAVGCTDDGSLPFRLTQQLFSDFTDDSRYHHLVTRAIDHYVALTLDRPGKGELSAAYSRVLGGIEVFLRDLGTRGPLLVLVDDAGRADPVSRRCLVDMMRRIAFLRALFVLTAPTGEATWNDPAASRVFLQPEVTHLRLAPLSPEDTVAIMARRTGTGTIQQARAVHRATGGNPLLTQALIEDHQEAIAQRALPSATEPVAGLAFERAVLSCLERAGPAVLDVAQAVAVLDDSGRPDRISRLLDSPPDAVDRGLRVLEQAGLLENLCLRHPVARRAVEAGIHADRRLELHRRAAALLHHDGARAVDIARHLVAAGHTEDVWVQPVLRFAAAQAEADDQLALAVEFLQHAVGACSVESERGAVLLDAAEADWRLSPSTMFHYLPRLTAAARKGYLVGRRAVVFVAALAWHGRLAEASAALVDVSDASTRRGGRIAADLDIGRLLLCCTYPGLMDQVHPVCIGSAAQPLTPATTDPAERAALALAAVLTGRGHALASTEAERLLLNMPPTGTGIEAAMSAALVLIYTDHLSAAAAGTELLSTNPAISRSNTRRALVAGLQAEIALRRGELPDAERHARAALTDVTPHGWGVGLGAPLASLLLAMVRMGRLADAGRWLMTPVPAAMFQTRFGLHYLHARGHFHLATGQLHEALADFSTCGDLMVRWGMDVSGLVAWRTDAAEAYLRLGQLDRSRRLVEEQLAREGLTSSRTSGNAFRLLAAASEPGERLPLLRQSVEVLRQVGARVDLARAMADLSIAYHGSGNTAQARSVSRGARLLANQSQAEAILEPPRQRAGHGQAESYGAARRYPPAAVDTLTDAERRVAALAALGHTNGEIADRLYITTSTVEQHLTRVYRKLNVRSRADLPAVLGPASPRRSTQCSAG
ncbi:helix-turn-helix transcriptional regulator [Frankia sp. AgKG'84/4]|uniref:helix-turn-helix transcriptional regulator n=1 Tax=Frankia sp. AgKG'84/4 TaxID=573490 RepID=UPI00200E63DC|nr:LuxR family transcriptional regulator [Frankia sp. AgKG'84/4]MCL9793960.1 LuxR C-terminal-related transcriptional regulator [Frankia sp. AgKG'84/4]